MIHSVLGNLLGNAIKFTPRNGLVRIEIERLKSMVRVNVIDTGDGLSPDSISGIFQEGESSRRHGTEGEHGSGLGLIISRQFVDRNGGEIGVQSTYGKGARFFFTVPVSDPSGLSDDQRASRS
jgi:signal transduction histidine kinase